MEVDGGPIFLDCVGTDPATTTISCDVSRNVCCNDAQGLPNCVATPFCGSPFECSTLEVPSAANSCTYLADLTQGQLATHLDIATASDSTVMISGYSPGSFPSPRYGDLVVGLVNNGNVSWSIVDGLPASGSPVEESGITPTTTGWRGGITAPGDNVGEFNAIAFDGSTVAISYYDRTNGDLKYASSTDGGTTWSIHTVYSDGDAGRYTSLTFMNGVPAISFLAITPTEDPAVPPSTMVRVAIAASATPGSSADWTTYPIVAEPGTPVACRASMCGTGLLCRADTGACGFESADEDVDCMFTDAGGMMQLGCGTGTECVTATDGMTFSCAATIPSNFIEDVLEVDGLYTALRATSTGLALVWHNRVRRTMMGSAFDSGAGTWRAPFNIDGFDAVGTGDAGYNADLFIDAGGNWHIAYVDGAFEELRHAQIDGTTITNANPTIVRTRIDDGTRPPRERSIVGTDADIVVLASGAIRVVYQDSTQVEALVATRAAGDTVWTLQGGNLGAPLDGADSTGFWTTQALDGDTSHIATWWFNAADFTNGTRVFTIP